MRDCAGRAIELKKEKHRHGGRHDHFVDGGIMFDNPWSGGMSRT